MAKKQNKPEQMWQRKSDRIYFSDNDMDFYFLTPLAFHNLRGSSIGECFHIASRIEEGNPTSWAQEWTGYATRVRKIAEACESKDLAVSAGEAYLRAFSYYRIGSLMQRPSPPEAESTYEAMQHCFRKGVKQLELEIEMVKIPYRNTQLPGYFMYGKGEAPRPTLVTTHGGEMFSEELYFWVGAAAMRRGFNVISIDTPGGSGLRFTQPEQDPRPFFEGDMVSLIDYAVSRPETDPERLAVMGFSGGGYIGMRLTSLDKRVRALIASAPIYDLYKLASDEFPAILKSAPSFIGDMLLKVATSVSPSTKVALERILWAAGVNKLSELLALMKEAGVVDPASITCPTLCLTGEGESKEQNQQVHYVYKHLPNPKKEMYVFTRQDGADAHCQMNNFERLQQVAFDWLAGVFNSEHS
jgi:pimeloyl-ACP methyl ester carboxylesterase